MLLKKITPSIRKFYREQYYKGVDNFINSGSTQVNTLFQNNPIIDKYKEMYVNIGLHIANWYFRSFEKYYANSDRDWETKYLLVCYQN